MRIQNLKLFHKKINGYSKFELHEDLCNIRHCTNTRVAKQEIKGIRMDIVKEVLEKQAKEAEKYRTINVNKHEEVKVDIGHLLISDPNIFDESELK